MIIKLEIESDNGKKKKIEIDTDNYAKIYMEIERKGYKPEFRRIIVQEKKGEIKTSLS